MKFERHFPTERLKPYIRQYVVSENVLENEYKVFPSSCLVIGFQYRGKLSIISDNAVEQLTQAGITGICDRYRVFSNSAGIGTILVYFTETGFTRFASNPASELFNQSLSLDEIFDRGKVNETKEKLELAETDEQRIKIVEHFLIIHLKEVQTDKLVVEAVKRIYQSKGSVRIKELSRSAMYKSESF